MATENVALRRGKLKRNDPRMNMAFYGEHLEFCRGMAWKNHQSITQYVNSLIAQEMSKHNREDWEIPEGCSSEK